MELSINFFSKTIFTLLLSLAVLTTACNNPAGDDDDEDHHEPVGAVLKMNENEIARYEGGEVTGQVEVASGETALITIYFLAKDGNEFQPDEPENSLNWKDIDEAVAEVEQHEEGGKWRFHIQGVEAGETSVVFQLFHDTHSDFDTGAFPVIVN